MKKFVFVLLAALALTFSSCEKLDDKEEVKTEQSALKSVEEPWWGDPQMTHHPTTWTLANSTSDFFSYEDVPPYAFTCNWYRISGGEGAHSGCRYLSTGGYGGYSWRLESHNNHFMFRESFLVRVEPIMDPTGYDGHVGFMVRGPVGISGYVSAVVACHDEGGDVNIIPNSEEEDDFMWIWADQDGVYSDPLDYGQRVTFTGDWQWVSFDLTSNLWEIYSDNPSVNFDTYAPIDDDIYVWFLTKLQTDGDYSLDFNFIVNGAVSSASPIPSGTYAVDGENDVYNGNTYTYTFEGGAPFNQYEWSTSPGKAQILSGQGTNTAQIKMLTTGNIFIYCKGRYNQMGWSSNKALLLNSTEEPPPQPPSPPTITGASTIYGSLPQVSSYSQPSGKEAYEWILPYGTSLVQQYNNIEVISFNTSGNKTIQGRYKENGVWSSYGYKSVYVTGY